MLGCGDEIGVLRQVQLLDDAPPHRDRLRQQHLAFDRRRRPSPDFGRLLGLVSRLTTFGRRGSIRIVAVAV